MAQFDCALSECIAGARDSLLPELQESRVARFAIAMTIQSLHDAQGYLGRARFILENGEHVAGGVVDLESSAFGPPIPLVTDELAPTSSRAPACEPSNGKAPG